MGLVGGLSCPASRPEIPVKKRTTEPIFISLQGQISLLAILVRKPRQPCSQNPSNSGLLNYHHDPQTAVILGFEAEVYVAGKLSGPFHSSNASQLSQDRNMLQGPSSVFSSAYMRLVAVIRNGQENAR